MYHILPVDKIPSPSLHFRTLPAKYQRFNTLRLSNEQYRKIKSGKSKGNTKAIQLHAASISKQQKQKEKKKKAQYKKEIKE